MKGINKIKIVIVGFFVMLPSLCLFSEDALFDFDGKGDMSVRANNYIIETIKNVSVNIPNSERKNIKNDKTVIPFIQLFKLKESGEEELLSPAIAQDKGRFYEFMPNDNLVWEFNCTGQDAKTWNVCWSYTFNPAIAGHNHTSLDPHSYSYIDQQTGKTLPTKICKSGIPSNTTFRIHYKAPVFSTAVYDKVEFSGYCVGITNSETHITVTAENVIQLNELTQEPYYAFKPSSQYHPSNHYATPDTIAKLKQIAWEYYQQFGEKLIITDIGLIWGGRYSSPPNETNEIPNYWVNGNEHFYHRYGRQADIRSSTINTPQKRKCLEELACIGQVEPILEGKAPGRLLGHDFSMLSEFELDRLDRVEHYHFNFRRPTDYPFTPKDDERGVCQSYIPPEVSACPKPYSLK